ncbi:MAG TPA: gephyrin-like molybdotransferase Glp [Terriglobales bacterium]
MASTPQQSLVLPFEDARRVVEEHAAQIRPHGRELLELLDSSGRILAEPVSADRNFPPFPRATRDGFAVRAGDLDKVPARLKLAGEIKAGISPQNIAPLETGQAAPIMTGAPVPPGADAVVMVEYTLQTHDEVEINKGIRAGDNIVPVGSEAKRGERLLSPGMRMDHSAIAVAASVGRAHLLVYDKPRVAILSTGDEIVDIEVSPGPTQIRNSNSYSLAAQVAAAGGEPTLLPIAPDQSLRLRELIADGLEADMLLLTGGVSMGKYDLVEQVLAEFHAEFLLTGALIQPGRPVVFGRIPDESTQPKYFFGLPGNPVSTMVCFDLFVRPVLEALTGRSPRKLIFLHAKLKSGIRTKTGLKRFLPGLLSGELDHAEVELAPWQGSGDIAAVARANAYVVISPDRECIEAGEWVPVMLK